MLTGLLHDFCYKVAYGFWARFDVYILLVVPLAVVVLILHNSRQARVVAIETAEAETILKEKFQDKSRSIGEEACKVALEKIFKVPFVKIKPAFLLNSATSMGKNKNYLEIDLFNQEKMVGVEYQGRQHYEYNPHFHKNKEAFQMQLYRDELKKALCEKNGVTLITVPYTVKPHEIHAYIVNELYRKQTEA